MLSKKFPSVAFFLQETSMHGLKFTVHSQSRYFERAFWLLAFILGLSLPTYFITKIWNSWEENPTVTTVDSTNFPVNLVPFPAVTICPVQQVMTKRVFDLTQHPNFTIHNFNALSSEEIISYLRKGLEFDENDFSSNFLEQNGKIHLNSTEYKQAMQFVAPKCEEVVEFCTWQRNRSKCSFSSIATAMGYCCVFNIRPGPLNLTQALITENEGAAFGLDVSLYSRLNDVKKCGPPTLDNSTNADEQCTYIDFGFEIVIHDPYEWPVRSPTKRHVGSGEILETSVQAVITESDDDLKDLEIKKRDCIFPGEFPMKLPLQYTYSNCLVECLGRYQKTGCNCLENYIENLNGSSNTCSGEQMGCIRNVTYTIKANLIKKCPCKPACNEITYLTEAYMRSITRNDMLYRKDNGFKTPKEREELFKNVSIVRVFFRNTRFTKYRRSNRYNWQDFASSVGGLMGLGFGFSLISAIEIVYFFCYKCFCPSKTRSIVDPMSEVVVIGKQVQAWTILPVVAPRSKIDVIWKQYGYY